MATTKSDPNVFLLPDLGEGVHEAELVSWKVKEGDTVEELQVLAEMETDQALAEVPSPRAGTIQTLHGKEGEVLEVGQPLVTFVGGAGEAAPAPAETAKEAATPAAAPPAAAAPKEEREDAGSVVGSLSAMPTAAKGKALATPAVRRLARDLGVDINQVPGSGIGGRVMEKDVRGFAGSGAAPAAPAATLSDGATATPAGTAPAFAPAAVQFPAVPVDASGVAERIPFRGVRRKIAESLSRSIHTAVHFTCVDEADVTALDQMRRQLAGMSGRKVSFLPFIMQAVCSGLKQHPTINANVDDENSEILIKGVINLGCAVDTDHGLMVPVVGNADRLTILELGDQVAALANA
ncbi:MAG: dihydrolipoamide acetyltransferase family protein, partial [Phycisphaerales bacterium JB038]